MGGAVTVLESPLGEWMMELALRRKVSAMVSSTKRLGSTRREARSSCQRIMVPRAGGLHNVRKPPNSAGDQGADWRNDLGRHAEVH